MDEEKKKKKKKRILIILFVLMNIGVIVGTGIADFSNKENAIAIKNVEVNWYLLAAGILCFAVAVFSEILRFNLITKKTCGKWDFRTSVKTVLLGKYYDNITPSGVGGQPFQIYHMTQTGYTVAQASTITLVNFIAMQFGFVLLGIGLFIFGRGYLTNNITRIMGTIGILIYAIAPVGIVLFTIFPKTMTKLMCWLVKILAKIKLVKDREKTEEKWLGELSQYSECMKTVLKKPVFAIECLLMGIFFQVALCSVPFFVVLAFGGKVSFIESLVTTVSIYAAITIIPTPGNSGAAEISFHAVFSSITHGLLFWAMISWRLIVYYFYLLIGISIYAVDALRGKKKTKPTDIV